MKEELEIEPISNNVLANLSIEELEQRLEMQLLQMPEGQFCIVNYCGVEGDPCGAKDICNVKDVCDTKDVCGVEGDPCGFKSS